RRDDPAAGAGVRAPVDGRVAAPAHAGQPHAGGGELPARARRHRVPRLQARRAARRGWRHRRDHHVRLVAVPPLPAAVGAVTMSGPAALGRGAVTIPPGGSWSYDEADWRDAVVLVVRGTVELEGASGRRRAFGAGAVLWLAGIPLRALRNPGDAPAVLVV